MSSCQLMFPGVRSSLVFSGFGLMPPASGFQSYFYSSLKTSPSPFEDNELFSECLMSSAGIQKLFCGIYSAFKCSFDEFVGEKVICQLRTASTSEFYKWNEGFHFQRMCGWGGKI